MPGHPKSPHHDRTTLKELAKHLGLTKGTVSAVLNDSPYAKAIPQHTKDRIIAAAQELNYHPNFFARSLRKKRTFTAGVIAAEIGDAVRQRGNWRHRSSAQRAQVFLRDCGTSSRSALLRQYSDILLTRGVEGFITIDTTVNQPPRVPTIVISGHRQIEGVTNITLDHFKAAHLVLEHLSALGHRDIAVIKGQPLSVDSGARWHGITEAARGLGIELRTELTTQLAADDPSPQEGYKTTKELLSRKVPFTALFAYNDISAVGAIRAIKETGLRVPEDISVVGFDDIREAAYHLPSLTTVRQPLRKLGEMAAKILMERLEGLETYPAQVSVDPELVIRESTCAAPQAPLHTAVLASAKPLV